MKLTYIIIGLLACALGIGIAQYMMPRSAPSPASNIDTGPQNQLIPTKLGGDFTLMQGDVPVKLSDYKDKLVVMYFGFTSCPDVCPTTLTVIASALKELTPEELEEVQPIFISIDPERDQGDNLMAYATYFHPSFIGITGTPEEVQKVANQYGAFFFKSKSDSALNYTMDHTSETYLIRDGGQLVSALPHEMTRSSLLEAIRAEL